MGQKALTEDGFCRDAIGHPQGWMEPAMEPEALLRDITDYCRKTGVAESTFGRLVVNDGKFVNRLRDGGRITTTTFQRVRHTSPAEPRWTAASTVLVAETGSGVAPSSRMYSAPRRKRHEQGTQFPLLRQSPEVPAVCPHLLGESGGGAARIDGARQYPSSSARHARVRRRCRGRLRADARDARDAQPLLHHAVLYCR